MRTRRSIFDSRAEGDLFNELDSRLNPKLRLMAQMPLRSVIQIDPETRAKMKRSHWRFYLEAVIDYTFVYPNGEPLLSIEFDGIGGGYSKGRRYVAERAVGDRNRAWKLDFKLRAAATAGHPLFVISGDELERLDEGITLMIVDGIVGQIFSRREERRLIQGLLADEADLLAELQPWSRDEHVQDLVLQAGVISDLEFDPLAIAVAQERALCERRFGFGSGGFHLPSMYEPQAPETDFPPSEEQLRDRIAAIQAADRVGAKVGIALGDHRYITATAWMRNVGQAHGLSPELITDQLAEFLAVRRAMRLAESGELDLFAEPSPFPGEAVAH